MKRWGWPFAALLVAAIAFWTGQWLTGRKGEPLFLDALFEQQRDFFRPGSVLHLTYERHTVSVPDGQVGYIVDLLRQAQLAGYTISMAGEPVDLDSLSCLSLETSDIVLKRSQDFGLFDRVAFLTIESCRVSQIFLAEHPNFTP
jgi:hypothetical protein